MLQFFQSTAYHNFEGRYELMFRIYNSSCKTRSQTRTEGSHLSRMYFRDYVSHLFYVDLYSSTRMRRAFDDDDRKQDIFYEFLSALSVEFSNHPTEYLKESADFYVDSGTIIFAGDC